MVPHWQFEVSSQAALERFAEVLAPSLRKGDVIALRGPLGAGKSVFARALIRALAAPQIIDEVPSPTFTLVQNYELARLPVAHFDLYRLSDPDELIELGFEEAMEDALIMIEWPEHAGGMLPADRLELALAPGANAEARQVLLTGHGAWEARIERLRAMEAFLSRAGWGTAERIFLHGDASHRSYERLNRDGQKAVLMNAPAQPDGPPIRDGKSYSSLVHLAEDVTAFVAIDGELRRKGLSAPEIHATDLDAGFIVLEDLGSETLLDTAGTPVPGRFGTAVDLLAALRGLDWPKSAPADDRIHTLAAYSPQALAIETELVLDWFAPTFAGGALSREARGDFAACWAPLFARLGEDRAIWTLRDFHSPNLLWLEGREGIARIGLIDFQDAVFGHPAYDLVSLVQDARTDMDDKLMDELYARYASAARGGTDFDEERFAAAFAILGAQRNTKILGIFTRLWRRDGKGPYLRHMPRIAGYLQRNLAHPGLSELAAWYREWLPQIFEPARLGEAAGTVS